MNNTTKKTVACAALIACMGLGGFAMTNGVLAATQHSVKATNTVAYVAQKHVDAKVQAYVTTSATTWDKLGDEVSFAYTEETSRTDVALNFPAKSYEEKEKDGLTHWYSTNSGAERELKIKFVFTNTETEVTDNVITVTPSWMHTETKKTANKYTISGDTTAKTVAYNEATTEFVYTFNTNKKFDLEVSNTWSFVLDTEPTA